MKSNRKGFTLIEMTIVLFIISLLILIIIPNLSNQRKHAKEIHTSAMVSVIQSQIDAYGNDFPKDTQINYGELKEKGYLTDKQINQAKTEGIEIVNNEAKK